MIMGIRNQDGAGLVPGLIDLVRGEPFTPGYSADATEMA